MYQLALYPFVIYQQSIEAFHTSYQSNFLIHTDVSTAPTSDSESEVVEEDNQETHVISLAEIKVEKKSALKGNNQKDSNLNIQKKSLKQKEEQDMENSNGGVNGDS